MTDWRRVFEEIDIESRAIERAADFSRISGILAPAQDMTHFFPAELEKVGWLCRLPHHTWSRIPWQSIRGIRRMIHTRGRWESVGLLIRDLIVTPDLRSMISDNMHCIGRDSTAHVM